jgi:hypothetical protein
MLTSVKKTFIRQRLYFAIGTFGALALSTAHAATVTVTTTADSGAGSLRQAVAASVDGGTIDFDIPTSDSGYDSAAGSFTITLRTGELLIVRDLTITGPANTKVAINAINLTRLFNIPAATVTIENLTLRNGAARGANGAIQNMTQPAMPGGLGEGGAILNGGVLTLRRCTLYQNFAVGGGAGATQFDSSFPPVGAAGGAARGGAISNSGTLVLIECTFSGDVATGGNGSAGQSTSDGGVGGAASGGAIANLGALTTVNCTFSVNSAVGGTGGGSVSAPAGNGGAANGGAISQIGPSSSAASENTIIAANTLTGGSGGPSQFNAAGATGIATGPDLSGNVTSQGHNLVGRTDGNAGWNGTDFVGGTTNVTRLDPLLGMLQDNGGPTSTIRPLPGSGAIDNADDAVLNAPLNLTSDERGFTRKVGVHADIGAVEVGLPQTGPAFTVTNTAEHDDGSCTTDDCTLLEAVNASNANADANTINFAAEVTGTIPTKTTPGGLSITHPVTINGPGARVLSISAESSGGRVFEVASENVGISGLTIANGLLAGNNGAGILVNSGSLSMTDCTIRGNYANSGGSGGGAFNSLGAALTLLRCTVSGNLAGVAGGGVYNDGTFSATNCTISGNTAVNGGGLTSKFQNGAPSSVLRNCTVTGNHASSTLTTNGEGGGGIYAEGGAQQYHVANTLVAGNFSASSPQTNPDVRGNFTSGGHNFIGIVGFSTGLTNGTNGDQIGTSAAPLNPLLDPILKNNGGATDTHALGSGSNAINAGDNSLAPQTDQRGYLRSGVSDIGAFEFNGTVPKLKILSITHASNGHTSLQGLGVISSLHTIEASSDLNADTFMSIGTTMSDGVGTWQYDDAGSISLPRRFYRLTFP